MNGANYIIEFFGNKMEFINQLIMKQHGMKQKAIIDIINGKAEVAGVL